MYYAVFCDGHITYLGTSQMVAIQKFDLKQPRSSLSVVRDLNHLIELFDNANVKTDRKAACQPTGKEMQAVGADFIDVDKISEPTDQETCQGWNLCGFSAEAETDTSEQGCSHDSDSDESQQSGETP